jgi:hypothetical protein
LRGSCNVGFAFFFIAKDKWGDDFPSPEDWDNEEYTGSLADSKVFTPSGGALEPITNSEPLVVESANPDLSSSLTVQNLSSSVASSSSQMSQSLDLHQPPSQLSQVSEKVDLRSKALHLIIYNNDFLKNLKLW